MTPRRGAVLPPALFVAAALGAAAWPSAEARACAEFSNGSVTENDRRPSLAYEQTLILFDADKHREHFVREVVFRASRAPFGFVVPTPTRPEVAKIKKSPFAELRESFPFRKARSRGVVAAAAEMGEVDVLEVTRVGRFTAFVVRASDAAGFSSWLSRNGFVSTPETAPWLAHYVKLGFFFVAMRYEPARGDKGKTTSETIRISFDSPFPYYPYLEPAPPHGTAQTRPRLLEIWLASTRDYLPVARRSRDKPDLVRPFLSGSLYSAEVHSQLALAVDSTLLPAGQLQLRRFADQKRSRIGFGDVVFVPASPDEHSPAPEALRAFTEILDSAPERPPAASDLLTGKAPAAKLPEVATEPGRSFDPNLRDRIAPLPAAASTVINGDAEARF